MTVFRVPDTGEGTTEAEIVEWLVAAGDRVVAGQALVSVETDKAVVEIASPQAGVVKETHGAIGDVVQVGDPLVTFANGEARSSSSVVGELPEAVPRSSRVRPRRAPPAHGAAASVRAAPAVRARARALDLDLAGVRGTGPGGSVRMDDVERAAAGPAFPDAEALRGVRFAMARNMARARDEVSPATVSDDADVHAWAGSGVDVMARLVRAVAAGCRAAPALHAWTNGRERRLHSQLDLAIAVESDEGLFAPVLRDVGNRSAQEIRADLDTAVAAVRERRASPELLRDPTFTLSNFGAIGGRYAQLVVVPPQVGILGAGRVALRPAVDEAGEICARATLPLSLTFDHRAATGAEAASFLTAALEDLERDT